MTHEYTWVTTRRRHTITTHEFICDCGQFRTPPSFMAQTARRHWLDHVAKVAAA